MDTEDAFTHRLSDYLDAEREADADRTLSAVDRAEIAAHLGEIAAHLDEIAAHLETCGACRATLAELRDVTARAASLPDAAPVTDLWPGVAARLSASTPALPFARPQHRRFSFTLPQLVAAGLALMVLSGGLVWVARLGDPRASLPPAVAQVEHEDTEPGGTFERTTIADTNYDQAIVDLERTLAAGRTRLDPETVRILDDNLRTIDEAIEQSRKALRTDPANVYLNGHFAASRNRKLALLRRASALAMATDSAGGS